MARIPYRQQFSRFVERYRPGPGSGGLWSPQPQASEGRRDWDVDREAGQIERAVAATGVVTRDRLFELVGARFWGPGRFRRALHQALARGRIRRVQHGMYGPPRRERKAKENSVSG